MMTRDQENELQEVLTMAYRAFGKSLTRHVSFKLNDQALGEDVVQETFLKTWRYLVREGKIEMMRAFLYHIANNLIIDEYRKHKTASLEGLIEKGLEPGLDSTDRLITMLDGKAAMLLIQHLLPPYQRVMRMRYVQGLTLSEMSLILGKSKNSVAVQVHRGLTKLRALYSRMPGRS